MTDGLSSVRRSENMRRIRSQNTKPEMQVRRFVHSAGYRFRLHDSRLPGKPDLVFPRLRKVVLIHGCFWHLHKGCREGRIPSSRQEYWEPKLLQNVARDKRNASELRRLGWMVLVVWECQLENPERIQEKVLRFLGG